MDKVACSGGFLNARSIGAESCDRTILLVHGLNANMAFWHPVLTRSLSDHQRSVVMYDQRGHGRSDMPADGYTPAELARDAIAVLDHFSRGQVDVVAHSFGGTVALQLARQFPERVRRLVLLDPRLRAFQPVLKLAEWPDFQRWKASLGPAGDALDADLLLDFTLPLYLADGAVRQRSQDLVANGFAPMGGGRRGAARYRRLLDETTAAADFQNIAGLDLESLRALSCPTLAIYGARSPFLESLQGVQRHLAGWHARQLDDGGHNFPVVYPERTARLILDFLSAPEATCVPVESRQTPGATTSGRDPAASLLQGDAS
jgi:pimeloyl-ACP methyl ester carboxylesterase